MTGKARYSVLYVPGTDQQKAKNILEKQLPRERCRVFIPRMEMYRRGDKEIRETAMFPGYVFLYTDMDIREVHEVLNGCRREMGTFLGELALRERRAGDPSFWHEGEEDPALYELSDLDEEETEFLDVLRQGQGLLAMSCGYEENRKCHVMEGPLKVFEGKIEKLDKHNRKAFLRFYVGGRQARAGFECKPKTHWFPKEDSKFVKLSDGAEVDLEELVQKIRKK